MIVVYFLLIFRSLMMAVQFFTSSIASVNEDVHECCLVFRWETLDSFMQHDVQELCRVVTLLSKFLVLIILCTIFLYKFVQQHNLKSIYYISKLVHVL